jgi:chitinase
MARGQPWLRIAGAVVLAVAAGAHAAPSGRAGGPVIIAYLFPKDAVVDPAAIAADKLTHINYAFANVADGRVVEGFAHDAENFRVLAGLRRRHPCLKILISVGGWTWSGGFSDAALTPENRRRFVASAADFVRRHDLDGFDVDWEYPGLPGYGNPHRPEDKQNFTALMAELRSALDREGAARHRHYLLTFAAGASSRFLAHTEMEKVQASVDFVNLMTYDFREAEGDPIAGHHANLYTHPADPDQSSADRAVREFLAAGVPPGKLVLGVPFYGRAWAEVESDDATGGLFRTGKKPSEPLDTHYANLSALVAGGGYERRWDRVSQAPYLWSREKRIFVTYDDPESLRVKSRYIIEHGLAGVMFWEYYADPTGTLHGTLFTELRGRQAGQ